MGLAVSDGAFNVVPSRWKALRAETKLFHWLTAPSIGASARPMIKDAANIAPTAMFWLIAR